METMQSSELAIEFALEEQVNLTNRNNANWALQIIRWYLKFLGVWPLSPMSSYFEKIFTHIVIVVHSFLLLFIFLPGILFIYIEAKSAYVAIKMLGGLSYCIMAIIKYRSLLSKRRDIAKCIKYVVADWKQTLSVDDRMIMIDCAKYGRWGSMICGMCMFSGGIFYSGILPYVTPSYVNENNVTIKPIAYQSYYVLFNAQDRVAYKIVCFTQICCTLMMNSITSVCCNIAVVFAMHACGQLRILSGSLTHFISNTREYQEFDKNLPKIIRHHTRTLRFISYIRKILNEVCLVEVVGCTMVICLLEYYILLEWKDSGAIGMMTYSTLLTSLIFNVFLFCYIGNLLTDECQKVGEATYMINWYELRARNIRHITLIMLTAQNPVTISAGGMANLSLITFTTVLRTSVTYLNLLRQVVV